MIRTIAKRTQIFITFLSLLLASTTIFASNGSDLKSTDPGYIIYKTLNKITTFSSNSDKVSPVKLRGFIENEIIPHFDFNHMSHWITGRFADNMSDKDKDAFQRNLRETFLTSLAKHLGSFDAESTRVRFRPVRYRGRDEAFVSTNVYRPDTMPVHLDFRMRLTDNDWEIIDVKANGSSAVLYYRRHFMAELRMFDRETRRVVY